MRAHGTERWAVVTPVSDGPARWGVLNEVGALSPSPLQSSWLRTLWCQQKTCERIREHTRVHSHALALAHGCAGVLRYARSAACAVAHDVLGVPSHAALCWAVRPAPRRGGAVRVRHASVGRDCQAFTFARHARFEAAGAAAAYRRYEVRACATVDASWASPATQRSPEMPAQTHLANARTNPEWRKEGSPPQSASSLGHTYLAPLPSCLATSLHPPLTSTLCTIPAPCA